MELEVAGLKLSNLQEPKNQLRERNMENDVWPGVANRLFFIFGSKYYSL